MKFRMKSLLYFIQILSLLVSVFGDETNTTDNVLAQGNRTKRLVGGTDTSISIFPYFISIEYKGLTGCGGVIISAYYALSAAHCKIGKSKHFAVRAGSGSKGRGGSLHPVKKFMTHPSFKIDRVRGMFNDIAVILVKAPFEFDEVRQPIQMFGAHEDITPGMQAFIVGLGVTESSTASENIQVISVPVVRQNQCNQYFANSPTGTFCAGYLVGFVGACIGDSGGPVIINGKLAGIVSAGIGCASPNFPGLNSAITYFHDWIHQHVQL